MKAHDVLICVIRPNNTSLWIPARMAETLKLERGDKLTPDQFASEYIQRLLSERTRREKR